MKRLYTLFFLFFSGVQLLAQVKEDSLALRVSDTTQKKTIVHKEETKSSVVLDTIVTAKPFFDSSWRTKLRSFEGKSFPELVFANASFFPYRSKSIIADSDIKSFQGKELLFYALTGLLLLFAFLKSAFAKYVNDLFRLFFRRTLKQRQITEQLRQTPLPSLIFNTFFIVTGGIYLSFILQHFGMKAKENFWALALYCSIGLGIAYLLKFVSLKFTGWVLNLSQATDSYIFIVFIINKVIGIFLLPFLVLLAFTQDGLYEIAMVLSWCSIGCLVIYRYILSYSAVHNQIKVKPFHFLVYIVAFEIVPLLLIYKLLFRFLF
ncbi:MAG: DUF4271 domain-containing protein [Bacteroidetes bacterium]|nr:DUF4271 domain-containing protein [Bacteroidota bacterium]